MKRGQIFKAPLDYGTIKKNVVFKIRTKTAKAIIVNVNLYEIPIFIRSQIQSNIK